MKVFCYDIHRPLSTKELACIPYKRRAYADSYRLAEDRARCLAAGHLLSTYLGRSADNLYMGKYGKPYTPFCTPFFNLSHAGRYVALAIAEREVGIDIEPITTYDDDVARKCFTPNEYGLLTERADNETFFRLWTAKESIMKACGKGFSLPPESFELQIEKELPCVVDGRSWHMNWIKFNNHILCTAVEQAAEPVELVLLD